MIAPLDALAPATGALALDTYQLTKRFGAFTALDRVTMRVEPGTVHALLGENGAGKSTLVKCVAGFHRAEEGSILVDGREVDIANPIVARQVGIGMVYQHFTLAAGMTVAENLLLAGGRPPALIDWRRERAALDAFLQSTPFRLDLDARPQALSAGEKQKLELLKQLYLKPRLLILDEPTSVLTPQEADEVLGHVRAFARAGHCTVLLITHKFREVDAYADGVTVLRRGRAVHQSRVADTDARSLAAAMVGAADSPAAEAAIEEGGAAAQAHLHAPAHAHAHAHASAPIPAPDPAAAAGPPHTSGASAPATTPVAAPIALELQDLRALGDRGVMAVDGVSLQLRAGEILGVAGVSGNGQRELLEAIVGQRPRAGGQVRVRGQAYGATRGENLALGLRCLPEEPLKNGCVAGMSVAQNMALRDFDRPPQATGGLLRSSAWRQRARQWVQAYGIKTQGVDAPIASLSGGNVQRAVLARELAGQVHVLIAANPVFGLDFAAVAEIHGRLRALRAQGGAVLLISEDLDELLALSDRIVVMSEGRIVHETPATQADRQVLGAFMGGGHGPGHQPAQGPSHGDEGAPAYRPASQAALGARHTPRPAATPHPQP
jgi:simple sugar transport system ATP-binding protein